MPHRLRCPVCGVMYTVTSEWCDEPGEEIGECDCDYRRDDDSDDYPDISA